MERESGANYFVSAGTLLVGLPAEVDDWCCEEMKKEMNRYFQNYEIRKLLFDFSKTYFMDSSGIGLLLYFYKRLKLYGVEICLYGEDVRMEKILRMSGIYQIMNHVMRKM